MHGTFSNNQWNKNEQYSEIPLKYVSNQFQKLTVSLRQIPSKILHYEITYVLCH